MPEQVNVARLFTTFVAALSVIVKEKVTEAVSGATAEFLHGPLHATVVKAAPKTIRRRAAMKFPASPKPVILSKHGKRIGRPPKK